jgi:hypothetical protein
MLHKAPSLVFFSDSMYTLFEHHLSKILENSTTVESVQLIRCKCSKVIFIRPPQNLRRLKINNLMDISTVRVDLSLIDS